jgi:hypothetical protein
MSVRLVAVFMAFPSPETVRTPGSSQVRLSYRLKFARGMKMADKPQDFFMSLIDAGRRIFADSKTDSNAGFTSQRNTRSNLIREGDLAPSSEDQLVDILGGSRQYLARHLDIEFVEVRLLGVIAFRLGGQGEEFVGDKAGAHQ